MDKMVLVIDEALKQKMISKGFKVIKEESNGTIFALDKKLQFNFDEVDKAKFTFISRLTF